MKVSVDGAGKRILKSEFFCHFVIFPLWDVVTGEISFLMTSSTASMIGCALMSIPAHPP